MALSFPFSVVLKVRGYELDLLGHVNNAVYLNWLEHTRWELFADPEGAVLFAGATTVVRHVELDYRAETRLGDTIQISTWPRHLGNTSFSLGSCMRVIEAGAAERVGTVALVAKTVMTCVLPRVGKVPVPEAWRRFFPEQDPGDVLPPGV